MTNEPKQYEQFGPEWEAEMKKWSKERLIAKLKKELQGKPESHAGGEGEELKLDLNFSPFERMKLLDSGNWSKDEVRRLIRDCEKLETIFKFQKSARSFAPVSEEKAMDVSVIKRIDAVWKDLYMIQGDIKAVKGGGQKERDEFSRIIAELQDIKISLAFTPTGGGKE